MANESPIDLASISSTAPRMLGGRIHERPLLTWPSTVQPTISYIYDSSPSAFATRPKDAGSSRVDTPGSEKAPTCQSRDSPLRCDTAEASEEGAHKGQDLDVNVDANAESNNRQSVYCCSGTLAFLEAPPIRPNVDTISQKLLEDSTAVAVELVGSAAFKLLGQFRRIVSPRGTRHEKSVSKPGSERSLRIESRVSELGTVGDSEGSGDSFHSFLDGEGAELEPITEQAQEMDDSWTMVENDRVNPSSSPESGYVEDISSGQSTSEEVSSSSSGGIMHQSAPDIEKAKVSFGEEMVIAINLVNGRTPGMPGLIPVKSVSRFSVSQSLTTTPSETGSMTPTAGRILEIGAARKERARGKGRGAQKRVKRQKARALGKVTPPRGGEKYGKLHNDCGYNPRLEEIRDEGSNRINHDGSTSVPLPVTTSSPANPPLVGGSEKRSTEESSSILPPNPEHPLVREGVPVLSIRGATPHSSDEDPDGKSEQPMIPSFPPTAVASPVSSSSGTTVSALVKTPADKDKEITEDDLIAVKKILSDIPIAYVRPETSENVGSKNEDTRTQSDDTRPGSIRQAPEAGLASASQLQDQSAPELNGIHMPHRQRRSQSFDEGTLANRHVAKHQQMGTLNNAQSQAPHNQRIAQASSYEGRSHTHRHRPWIPSLDSSQQPREEAYIARNIVHVPPPQWVQQRQNETSEAAQWPGAPIVPTNNTQYTPFDRNGQRVLKRPFPPQQAHLNAGQQGYIPYHPPNKPLIPSPNVHQGNPYSQYSYQTPISPPVPVWDPYTQSFYWNILPQDHPIPVTPYSNFQPSSHMNAYRSSIHPPMPPPSHSNPNNVYCTAPNPPSQGHKYVPLDSTSTREQSHPGRITAPAPTYQDGIRTSKAEPDIYVPHRSSSLNRKDILGQNTLTREGSRRGRQQETNLDRGRSRSRSREQRHTKTMRNKDEEQGRSKRTSRQVSKVNMGVWDENQEQRILPKADKSDLGTEEVEKTVHVSSENFERIILDLEEMLNQALELAGRAVEGGTLAGGLGYSPSTRKEGAKLVKRRSTRNGYENGMKRTKSGKMRNGVTAPREGDQEKSLGLLAGPHESHSGESICLNALAPSGQKFASHDTLVAAANRQINSGISKSYSSSVMKGTGLDKGSIISGSSVEKLMSASAEAISSGLGLAGSSSRLRLALQQEEAGAGERLIDDQQLGDDGKSQHQQNYTMREVLEIGPGLLRQLSIANGTEGMNGGTTTVMDIGMHDRSRKDRESGGDEYHKYLVELSMTQNMRNEPPAGRYTGIEKGTRANRKNLQEYLGNPERKTIFAGKVNEHMRDGNPKDWSNPRVGKLAGDGMGGARSWSISKKRFLSVIMILLTAFIWGIVGGYEAQMIEFQSKLSIRPHFDGIANIILLFGIAIPTLLLWPLPLLQGRKPYLLLSISLLPPLQLPQALPLIFNRMQEITPSFQVILLIFRGITGVVLGFANMNIIFTLTDMWGVDTGRCCRAGVYSPTDLAMGTKERRDARGGGLGAWLGMWAISLSGGYGMGYCFESFVNEEMGHSWGFWWVAIIAAVVTVVLIWIPEVRPAVETNLGKGVKKREAQGQKGPGESLNGADVPKRGELGLFLYGRSPRFWWQEVWAGWILMGRMCGQTGFMILFFYGGWSFGSVILIGQLLASLMSKQYSFRPIAVGLCLLSLPIGALLSLPFQLQATRAASSDSNKSFTSVTTRIIRLSPHPGDRHENHRYPRTYALFLLLLPCSYATFTIVATGPGNMHFIVPIFITGVTAFATALSIAEVHALIMDFFDISDLPKVEFSRRSSIRDLSRKTTGQGAQDTILTNGQKDLEGGERISFFPLSPSNSRSNDGVEYHDETSNFNTIHPMVTAGFALLQFSLVSFAATATAWSVLFEKTGGVGLRLGAGIVTAVMVFLTLGVMGVLYRWREVEVGIERRMYLEDATNMGNGPMGVSPILYASGVPIPVTSVSQALERGAGGTLARVRMVRNISIMQSGKRTRWTEAMRREYWSVVD